MIIKHGKRILGQIHEVRKAGQANSNHVAANQQEQNLKTQVGKMSFESSPQAIPNSKKHSCNRCEEAAHPSKINKAVR